ncbi:hypothetical protein [Streptomyces sp. NPDC054866]
MRKKLTSVLGAAVLTGAVFASTPAVAASSASPAASGGGFAAAACHKQKAQESVKIRKTKSVNGTALGLVPKGKIVCKLKNEKARQWYDKCGQGSDQWNYISYRGLKGWVPTTCVVNV